MIKCGNNFHWLSEQSRLTPDARAIITRDKVLSYSEFHSDVINLADNLVRLGIKEKEHVGILYRHSYFFTVVVNAIWFTGAVPVPINTRCSIDEIRYQIQQAGLKHLLLSEELSEHFSELSFRGKNIISESLPGNHSEDKQDFHNSSFSPLNKALIMFTSGSSGKPKAVVHNFNSLFESVNNLDSFSGLQDRDVWLASLPLYHIGGFMIPVRALLSGGSLVFPDSLRHEDLAGALKEKCPTHLSFVSTTLARFIDDKFVPSKNLKHAFLGGGPATSELCIRAIDNYWPIVKVYGSTETCSMVTALLPEDVKLRPDSSGKVTGSNKITIKDNSGAGAGIIDHGEILVSSKSLFTEYLNDPKATESVLQNGVFSTGDLGSVDNEGYLYLSSRRNDLIITGGENVSPLEIEETLLSKSSVKDAFVFSASDDKWGEIVCAAVVSENESETEIKNFLKEKIAGYKIPKRYYFLDHIPRTEMGKVKRGELMKLLNLG